MKDHCEAGADVMNDLAQDTRNDFSCFTHLQQLIYSILKMQ